MGLDALHLRVLMTSSDNEKERVYARKVLKLLNRGRHWVLVVLLLGNVVSLCSRWASCEGGNVGGEEEEGGEEKRASDLGSAL